MSKTKNADSVSDASPQPAPEYLDVVEAWQRMRTPGQSDQERNAKVNTFYCAIENYLAAVSSLPASQQLAELHAIWRMDEWDGRDGPDTDPMPSEIVQMALVAAIGRLTGISKSPLKEL
ncbi:MAG: hypothetical protein J0H37_03675 [Hyphomicrobium denitrificans]|nr:hypothetical protein [Hyphomicrobium denitrificans]